MLQTFKIVYLYIEVYKKIHENNIAKWLPQNTLFAGAVGTSFFTAYSIELAALIWITRIKNFPLFNIHIFYMN